MRHDMTFADLPHQESHAAALPLPTLGSVGVAEVERRRACPESTDAPLDSDQA